MAEFCKECFYRLATGSPCQVNESVILSEDFDLCEGCDKWKKVVIMVKEDKVEKKKLPWWKEFINIMIGRNKL